MGHTSDQSRRSVLVTDFDGTITDREFYDLAVAAYLPSSMPDYWGRYASGEISHFDAISAIFKHLQCSEEDLRSLVWRLEPDPGFAPGVRQLQAAGWDVVVVSNGSHWYIDPLMRSLDVDVPVYSSPGRFGEQGGLWMDPPLDSPYFNPAVGVDKERLVKDLQRRHERVAFAGNGSPDRAAALAVAPELRFARRWLAKWLDGQGHAYRPFQRWGEIATALVSGRQV